MKRFFKIQTRKTKDGPKVYPTFLVNGYDDFIIKGKEFFAIWDEKKHIWSTDESDVCRIVDEAVDNYILDHNFGEDCVPDYMSNFCSGSWEEYKKFVRLGIDKNIELDSRVIFADEETDYDDYATKKLPYSLTDGDCPCYDELISTLYSPSERAKIEWAIGAVFSGDTRKIQKFLVFYGSGGSGKSTILNIVEKLFKGYCEFIDVNAVTSGKSNFATSNLAKNPLVLIQHDVDLSKIRDNSTLNSLVSHEKIDVKEKYRRDYQVVPRAFLFLATNKPVLITDGKSGLIRRLIEVNPSGNVIPATRYFYLTSQIDSELGAIANRCIKIYETMGRDYYMDYRASSMMSKSDAFYNFVLDNYIELRDGIALKTAYAMYKKYCDEAKYEKILPKFKFKNELANYFDAFHAEIMVDGERHRNFFIGFKKSMFMTELKQEDPFGETSSVFDSVAKGWKAQYATSEGIPEKRWDEVVTVLSDLDTSRLHYVMPPSNHIVIDMDLKDENGNKSYELNLAEMRKWPETYSELSKSGAGIHLHYIYPGDVSKLKPIYKDGVEVKIFRGKSSLRRKLTKCNGLPVAILTKELPLKEEREVINEKTLVTEKGLRSAIMKALEKKVHPNTKPSVDFIAFKLEEAYDSGLVYDLSDLHGRILSFAASSTNNSEYCVRLVSRMKFTSANESLGSEEPEDERLVFFDVEVFPNLLVVCYAFDDSDEIISMINPSAEAVQSLFKYRLVGFNNRRYDNHILYARSLGMSLGEVYSISQRIVAKKDREAFFREAYNLSYTDIYDFSSKKQSLKKFEIELGIHHQELGLPWSEPVPEEKWAAVAEYCKNDILATKATFYARKDDWVGRTILAKLSGLSVNATNRQHATRIMFGDNKTPQSEFVYTDLSTIFPGYKFERGKSTYLGEEVGEGGYVYAEPGIYYNVKVYDVESMHPHSIKALNLFGVYTKRFVDILEARLAIKHGDTDKIKDALDGQLADILKDESVTVKGLSTALKLFLNSIYGYTDASFENPFRDPRNIDNIVAKRGALFMVYLKHELEKMGQKVIHIKTDSIKLSNPSREVEAFILETGRRFGYIFDLEHEYERMCLINDAVFIAKEGDKWSPTGAEFAVPYVFKTLFSKEPIEFDDLCVVKSVSSSAIYLDYNEDDPEQHNRVFVGSVGRFTPILPGRGGAELVRELNDKFAYVTGSKGYRWMESETALAAGKEDDVDLSYFDKLVEDARKDIEKFGIAKKFLGEKEI